MITSHQIQCVKPDDFGVLWGFECAITLVAYYTWAKKIVEGRPVSEIRVAPIVAARF